MKQLFIIASFCLVSLQFVAQVPAGTGLLCTDDRYIQVPLLPTYTGVKFDEIPIKISLKKYAPVPGDQGALGTCVGWAAGYHALTMLRAIRTKQTDRSIITKKANSAAFVYNQIKISEADCQRGAYMEDALTLLKTKGDCLEESFNYGKADCLSKPIPKLLAEAAMYRIQDFAAVFEAEENGKEKVNKICKVLARKIPVVVGMGVTKSFLNIAPGAVRWNADAEEPVDSYHAMVVTGYDNVEKRFELLNSFGPGWGNGGFISISYSDFERLCRYAYVLLMEDGQTVDFVAAGTDSSTLPSVQAEENNLLTGEFVFRRPTGYASTADGRELLLFEEVPALRNAETGIYAPVQPSFAVGDVFQLLARNIPRGRYVYVFSCDPNGKVDLHFPKTNRHGVTADFVLDRTAEIAIPTEETALQLPMPGEDYLCILYSHAKIANITDRIQLLKQGEGNFPDRLTKVFQDVLIPLVDVRYQADKMSFQAIAKPVKGAIATAVVLKVTAE
jgi:Papain family cysteine protease